MQLFCFSVSDSLRKRLMTSHNLEAVKSIAWGINHEDVALKQYRSLGACVQPTGIFNHETMLIAFFV